jgi:hypothetical protein
MGMTTYRIAKACRGLQSLDFQDKSSRDLLAILTNTIEKFQAEDYGMLVDRGFNSLRSIASVCMALQRVDATHKLTRRFVKAITPLIVQSTSGSTASKAFSLKGLHWLKELHWVQGLDWKHESTEVFVLAIVQQIQQCTGFLDSTDYRIAHTLIETLQEAINQKSPPTIDSLERKTEDIDSRIVPYPPM